MTGTLTICATPIGNLDDVSPRLRSVLAAADVVYAEDTRRTAKLLAHLGVAAELRSYYVGNERTRSVELQDRLAADASVALVSDAGTPGVADPGVSAVRAAAAVGAAVSVVPGPSAVTAALSVSGFGADRFVFEGYLPRSGKKRVERMESVGAEVRTVVVFAAPSRVAADLTDLVAACGGDRSVVVARELTKIHEELWRGTLDEAAHRWGSEVSPRGEFTIVIDAGEAEPPSLETAVAMVVEEVEAGATLSEAARMVASASGLARGSLYEAVLAARKSRQPD